MTNLELEMLLIEKCKVLDLKRIAFENLNQIFKDIIHDKNFLGGFIQDEIKTVFVRFEYQVESRLGVSIIRTRIGLYIEDVNQIWLDKMLPIGYYALDTDFSGTVIDDWFVIDKDKTFNGL